MLLLTFIVYLARVVCKLFDVSHQTDISLTVVTAKSYEVQLSDGVAVSVVVYKFYVKVLARKVFII